MKSLACTCLVNLLVHIHVVEGWRHGLDVQLLCSVCLRCGASCLRSGQVVRRRRSRVKRLFLIRLKRKTGLRSASVGPKGADEYSHWLCSEQHGSCCHTLTMLCPNRNHLVARSTHFALSIAGHRCLDKRFYYNPVQFGSVYHTQSIRSHCCTTVLEIGHRTMRSPLPIVVDRVLVFRIGNCPASHLHHKNMHTEDSTLAHRIPIVVILCSAHCSLDSSYYRFSRIAHQRSLNKQLSPNYHRARPMHLSWLAYNLYRSIQAAAKMRTKYAIRHHFLFGNMKPMKERMVNEIWFRDGF